jgi:SIR2-like domain
MGDLRQLLSLGRKRIGILLGAGAPASISVDASGAIVSSGGHALVPTIIPLTKQVLDDLSTNSRGLVDGVIGDLPPNPNIEHILSRVRAIEDALGKRKLDGKTATDYAAVAKEVCEKVGSIANAMLPTSSNPYSELVAWIGGTQRDHAVEIFTTNYDLLLEQAFERARIPYFDGFSGSRQPFFDPATVAADSLPPTWARVWKIHGSIGWERSANGEIVRLAGRSNSDLIYPTHLKYDQTQKMPYSALMERLRTFLLIPDSLLLASGFSFADSHISAVLDECLAANPATALLAIQFRSLANEPHVVSISQRRANASVYASDGAIVNCIQGEWRLGDLPNPAWASIRETFWGKRSSGVDGFLLGDFNEFARYVALTRT